MWFLATSTHQFWSGTSSLVNQLHYPHSQSKVKLLIPSLGQFQHFATDQHSLISWSEMDSNWPTKWGMLDTPRMPWLVCYEFVLIFKGSWRVSLTVSQDLKVNLFGLQQDNVVTVMVRIMMWELPGDSHAVTIQWVCMVKDPLATILLVHTVTSKYTFTINNDRYLITWP